MRVLLFALVVMLFAGCDNPTGNTPPLDGTYELTSFGPHPGVGSLHLGGGIFQIAIQSPAGYAVAFGLDSANGKYSVDGDVVTFHGLADAPVMAHQKGGRLTMTLPGLTFVRWNRVGP
jgi:hypothetical protein